jgi:hypothetical protein
MEKPRLSAFLSLITSLDRHPAERLGVLHFWVGGVGGLETHDYF